MSKIIAIINQKGGVGKTTTALNLGVGLSQKGKKVLLIDADPQGSLTISLGIKNPDELASSLSDSLKSIINDEEYEKNIFLHKEGIWYVPSNIELSGTENMLFNAMSREHVLQKYLAECAADFDYVLIDCMPSLGMLTINALVASDGIIIPTQPNFLSTKGLDLLIQSAAKVKRSVNPKLKIDGILLTMVEGRTNNAKAIISSLRNGLGQRVRVFDTEIPKSVNAAECALLGESIFKYRPESKLAEAYGNLTKEVIELEEKSRNRPGPDRVR